MCPELLGKLKIMFQFVLPSPRIWSEMPLLLLLLLLLAALLLLLVVLLVLLVSQDLSWAAFARSKNWVRQVSVWQLTLFATSREIKSSPLRAFSLQNTMVKARFTGRNWNWFDMYCIVCSTYQSSFSAYIYEKKMDHFTPNQPFDLNLGTAKLPIKSVLFPLLVLFEKWPKVCGRRSV